MTKIIYPKRHFKSIFSYALFSETGNSKVEYMHLDLASFTSVRTFIRNFKSRDLPLHLLILNAGCFGEQCVTKDGFEMSFGVNYFGHFVLTKFLLDLLHSSVPSRIIVVSSEEHYNVKSIPYEKVRAPTTLTSSLEAYQVSKLATVIFAKELAKRLSPGVTVSSVNPGSVATNLYRKLPVILEKFLKQFTDTVEEGVRSILYCAISEEMNAVSGQYISSTCRIKYPNPVTKDPAAGETLWQNSEAWITDVFREEQKKDKVEERNTKVEEKVEEKQKKDEVEEMIEEKKRKS